MGILPPSVPLGTLLASGEEVLDLPFLSSIFFSPRQGGTWSLLGTNYWLSMGPGCAQGGFEKCVCAEKELSF